LRVGRIFLLVAIILGVGFVYGLLPRLREKKTVAADTKEMAQLTVAVITPAPTKPGAPLVLSGELKPQNETMIHARVSGYVRRWNVDLGAQVKAGQLLAELDTPDTERALTQGRAQLAQAESAQALAEVTARRWKEMLGARTVSPQEADEKASDLELKKAEVESAKANVQRLEEISGFAHITAPFPGTVTARTVELGQLITAGEGRELFRLAQTDKLRVFVRVPQTYAGGTTVGQTAEIMLPERPGEKFAAKIVRTAGALEAATRTLLTELEVDNAKGDMLAGSYAQVRLPEILPRSGITVPANAIIFRAEGPQVAVVVDDRIALHSVELGRDFGPSIEVKSGVTATDRVVLNPSDALKEGATVRVVEAK
jgi:RND family efflux transporter MFP subunit